MNVQGLLGIFSSLLTLKYKGSNNGHFGAGRWTHAQVQQNAMTARPVRWMTATEEGALLAASGGDKVLAGRLMLLLHGMLIDECKRSSISEVEAQANAVLRSCS